MKKTAKQISVSSNVIEGTATVDPAPTKKPIKITPRRPSISDVESMKKEMAAEPEPIVVAEASKEVKTRKPAIVPIATVPVEPVKDEGPIIGYRLDSTPRGRALFTYFIAVLTHLKVFSAHRPSFKREDADKFFKSDTAMRYHTNNGNLEVTKQGLRLTVTGWNYLHGRLTGSTIAQKVDEPEMLALAEAINNGKLSASTHNFRKDTKFVPVR